MIDPRVRAIYHLMLEGAKWVSDPSAPGGPYLWMYDEEAAKIIINNTSQADLARWSDRKIAEKIVKKLCKT